MEQVKDQRTPERELRFVLSRLNTWITIINAQVMVKLMIVMEDDS